VHASLSTVCSYCKKELCILNVHYDLVGTGTLDSGIFGCGDITKGMWGCTTFIQPKIGLGDVLNKLRHIN